MSNQRQIVAFFPCPQVERDKRFAEYDRPHFTIEGYPVEQRRLERPTGSGYRVAGHAAAMAAGNPAPAGQRLLSALVALIRSGTIDELALVGTPEQTHAVAAILREDHRVKTGFTLVEARSGTDAAQVGAIRPFLGRVKYSRDIECVVLCGADDRSRIRDLMELGGLDLPLHTIEDFPTRCRAA